jgi:uracil permease
MFGATVLVPMLTGLSPSVALISAGLGTLVFHLVTKRMVPVFLGSSFAFIGAILAVGGKSPEKLPYACGGLVFAGLIYVALSMVVRLVGTDLIRRIFPPVVTGPVIMVIGLNLAPVAVGMASGTADGTPATTAWPLALIAMLAIVVIACFARGFARLVPIVFGVAVAYAVAAVWGKIDYSALWSTSGFLIRPGDFMLPRFSLAAIATIAPIAIVTVMEHIGDLTTNSAVVGKDFLREPGLHRTLLGDGLATVLAGLIGGPANTTYSENTGVLAVTGNYNPAVIRLAAGFAILLGVIKPVGAVLQTIPTPIMGGVCFILFGMIASIGLRTISDANLDFRDSRNLMVVTLILVTGLAGVKIPLGGEATLEGISLAALVGLVANLALHVCNPTRAQNAD